MQLLIIEDVCKLAARHILALCLRTGPLLALQVALGKRARLHVPFLQIIRFLALTNILVISLSKFQKVFEGVLELLV